MSLKKTSLRRTAAIAIAAAVTLGSVVTAHAADPTWTVKFDNTSVASPSTRSLRSLALTPDGTSYYAGFIQGSTSREIRIVNTATNLTTGTLSLGADMPNTIATDDRGNVFVGMGGAFRAYDAALTATPLGSQTIAGTAVEGIDIYKTGSNYFAYVSRSDGIVSRYNVTNPASPSLDTTYGTLGFFAVPGAGQLRGLDVDASGNVFVAQRDTTGSDRAGKVFRLSNALIPTVTPMGVTGAMDVNELNGSLYVTEYNGSSSAVAVLDATTLASMDLFDTNFPSRGTAEGYAMFDVTAAGRLLMVDQIYGGSGSGAGTLDRVLLSSPVPEPTTVGALAIGAVGLLARRRTRVAK